MASQNNLLRNRILNQRLWILVVQVELSDILPVRVMSKRSPKQKRQSQLN